MNDGKIVKDIPRNDIKNMDNGGLEKCNLRTFDLHTIEFSLEQRASGNKEHADFEIDNVSFSYKSSLSILQKCSLKANYGDTVAIIGHNGEGKTTLGKIIAGLLRSETGQFFLDGKQIKQKELYKSVYFVMQDADYQLYSDSVMSELRLSGEVSGNIDDEEIENTMKLLNIFEFKDYHPQALSGGQKQRVTIAAAMTSNKRIIVFDEPTSGHDLEFLSKVATKAVFVEEGKINNTIRLTDNSDFKIIRNFLLQKEIENYA